MNVRYKRRWVLAIWLCLIICLLCGCKGSKTMEIDTSLELNTSFKGQRVMSTFVSEAVFRNVFHNNVEELQKLVHEKCPATMLCQAEEVQDGVKIIMTLEFANYKDYVNKIGLILGKTPGIYYDASKSVFKNGFMLQENFASKDLFGWLVEALKEKEPSFETNDLDSLFKSGTTMVHYAGRTFETSDMIQIEDMDSKAFKRISAVITMNEDNSYKAELNFIVDQDTYYEMGETMDDTMKDLTPDGGLYEVSMVDKERIYTISFSALNEKALVKQMNVVLHTKKCKFTVEAEGDASDPFRAHKEIVIYLDGAFFLDFTKDDTELIYKLNVDSQYGVNGCESSTGFLKNWSSNTEGKYTNIYMTVRPSDEVHVRLTYGVEMEELEVHTKVINDHSYERSFQFTFSSDQAKLIGETFENRLKGRLDEDMELKITDSTGYKSYTVSYAGSSLEELSKKTTQFLDGSVSEDEATFTSSITGGKVDKKTLKTKSYVYKDQMNFERFLGSASLKDGITYRIEYPRGYKATLEEGAYSNVREENNELRCTIKDQIFMVKSRGATANIAGMTQLILWWGSLGLTLITLVFNLRHFIGYLRKKEGYLEKVDLFKGMNLIFMTLGLIAVVVFVFTTFRLIFRVY